MQANDWSRLLIQHNVNREWWGWWQTRKPPRFHLKAFRFKCLKTLCRQRSTQRTPTYQPWAQHAHLTHQVTCFQRSKVTCLKVLPEFTPHLKQVQQDWKERFLMPILGCIYWTNPALTWGSPLWKEQGLKGKWFKIPALTLLRVGDTDQETNITIQHEHPQWFSVLITAMKVQRTWPEATLEDAVLKF